MRLGFVMYPSADLRRDVEMWKSHGLGVLWQPDDRTVLLGSDGVASVMIEEHEAERRLGPGPVFLVSSVAEIGEPADGWAIVPVAVPVGQYAVMVSEGTPVRLLDLTKCPRERLPLFGGVTGPLSLAVYRRGPGWIPGISLREQPGLLDHGRFLARLERTGQALAAGPAHLLDEVPGAQEPIGFVSFPVPPDEARQIVADDPGLTSGLLQCEIRDWHVADA